MAPVDSQLPLPATVPARPHGPALAAVLLAWYDRERRVLPWRAAAGARPDPYRVWLSEIMLQQTTVAVVAGYFDRFLGRWPTVEALAQAPGHAVMEAWAGLGYYARARNLHACAKTVAAMGGRFPDDVDGLKRLPGIGDYTAAAIAAIAFGRPEAAVDGNVERVVSRLARLDQPLPKAKPAIRALTEGLLPPERPGDFAQAMMDLGATICLPKAPACGRCPVARFCQGSAAGDALRFPIKPARPERPTRRGIAYVAIRDDGAVLLQERPAKGLLGGMMEVPGTAWEAVAPPPAPPCAGHWTAVGTVEHSFTHFHLVLTVMRARVGAGSAGRWVPRRQLGDAALPSLYVKVLKSAQVM